MQRGFSRKARDTARGFRQNATEAERKLWRLLRGKHMKVRFRRQQPLGPYIADFFCPSAALVIELDGFQHHAVEQQALHDLARNKWLETNGYRVLRFWNADVLKAPELVMETIAQVLDNTPLPENRVPRFSTLPQGEGK